MASPVKRRIPAHPRRHGAGNGVADFPGVSGLVAAAGAGDSPSGKFDGRGSDSGHTDNRVNIRGVKMSATAYGPPWTGIQGTGVTAGGTNLKDGHPAYIIAADPSVLPLGTEVYVWPNPHDYKGRFLVDDTGGAIKGNRIDIYDWRGRASQNKWGRRTVEVNRVEGGDFSKKKPLGSDLPEIATAPFAAVKRLIQMVMSLFYPGTWVRIGKIVFGAILIFWGVNALMKSVFGVDTVGKVKGLAGQVAVAKAVS